jgi:hypothetical protein
MPVVWQRQRTAPLWATTTFSRVGSATIVASGTRGSSFECGAADFAVRLPFGAWRV